MSDGDRSRRFSREEMERILEVASRPGADEGSRAVEPVDPDDGFTLAEIQEIAGEVGIDPARVEAASREMGRPAAIEPRVSPGTYQGERSFGRRLTPDEMRFMAEEADRFFGSRGEVRQVGGYLEWYNQKARAFVGIVNEGGTARARVIVDRSIELLPGVGGVGVLGLIVALELLSQGGVVGGIGAIVVAFATAAAAIRLWEWRMTVAREKVEQLLELMTLPGWGA